MAGRRDLVLAKLAFDLEAGTKGFHQDLKSAQAAFTRFSAFVKANPVVAVGALAAAAAAAGFKAAEMARQFDAAARKIAAVIPQGTARLQELKKAADRLAVSRGLTSDQVLGGLQAVAREGVESLEALTHRFEVLQKAADATSTSVEALAAPFDQILDVFGLADEELEKVAATLAKISLERGVAFEDFLAAFQSAAPTIRDAGLSFEEGASAIGKLLQAGLSAKQTGAELKEVFTKLGREGVRGLTEELAPLNERLAELDERARANAESAERVSNKLREAFLTKLRGIGASINRELVQPLLDFGAAAGLAVLGGGGTNPILDAFINAVPGLKKPSGAPSRGGPVILPEITATGLTPEAAKKLRDELAKTFLQVLPDAIEATVKAIGELGTKLRRLGAPADEVREKLKPLIDRLKDLQDKARAVELEQTRAHLSEIVDLEGATLEQRLAILDAERAAIAEEATLERSAEQQVILQARLAAYDEEIARLRREQYRLSVATGETLAEAGEALEKTIKATSTLLEDLADIARAAIGVAQAFDLVNDSTAAALQNVVSIAEALPRALAGDTSAIAAVLGGLAGLFSGESADAQRDREIRRQNTEAIRELTKTLSDQLTGATATQARAGVEALLAAGTGIGRGPRGGQPFTVNMDEVRRILATLGLSFEDFVDLLHEINPALDLNTSSWTDFIDSLEQVQQAINAIQFRAFAESFAGQLAFLQAQFDLMDISNPLEQLEAIAAMASGQSPLLEQLLGGLDLSTAAGRAQAEQVFLDLLNRLRTPGAISAEDLGNLSPTDLLDLIRQLEELIDRVNEEQGTVTGGPIQESFGVQQTITQATGSQITGLLTSQDIHLVEIRDILASLAGFTPVSAPMLPLAPAAGDLVVNVYVNGAVDGENAEAVGRMVGESAADALDARLGVRRRARAITVGQSVVH